MRTFRRVLPTRTLKPQVVECLSFEALRAAASSGPPAASSGGGIVAGASAASFRSLDLLLEREVASLSFPSSESSHPILDLKEEARWKRRLNRSFGVVRTPKHLTWKELGQELDCLRCDILPDPHRPEEVYSMSFHFSHPTTTEGGNGGATTSTSSTEVIWEASGDVSFCEGLTDLLAAIGCCLGRAEVRRVIRFDDGAGTRRDIEVAKLGPSTSDILITFHEPVPYDLYEAGGAGGQAGECSGGGWGYHPSLVESRLSEGREAGGGGYQLSLSAHALSTVVLQAIDRLLDRPLQDFYRASEVSRTRSGAAFWNVGLSQALLGWLGLEERVFPHFTTLEAVQDHWLGADVPHSLTSIINRLREMTYLSRRNPEFHAWLARRRQDSAAALRKLLGRPVKQAVLPGPPSATATAHIRKLLPRPTAL